MNVDLKAARKELREKARPYQAYNYYLAIPILTILSFVARLAGSNAFSNVGTIILVFAIFSHVWVSKLDKVSNRKHVGPILLYVANGLSLLAIPMILGEMTADGSGAISLGLLGLILLPIEIISIVFYFLSANDIKKAYPTMKLDAGAARQAYREARKAAKNK